MTDGFESALILLANDYRFAAGEIADRPCVHSRMQLWCHAGRGSITVNQETFAVEPGSTFILPWGHHITYRADRSEPMFVSGIHLIPFCEPPDAVPWYEVANNQEHRLAQVDWMADRPLNGLERVIQRKLPLNHSLLHLGAYICSLFQRSALDREAIRLASQSLIQEWMHLLENQQRRDLPNGLDRVCSYITHHLHEQLSLQQYARIAGCSGSNLNRQARRHLGKTILQWQRDQQMAQACQQLRSSNLSIQHIAKSCGYDDPLYFSRIFKQAQRLSPRRYRQLHLVV